MRLIPAGAVGVDNTIHVEKPDRNAGLAAEGHRRSVADLGDLPRLLGDIHHFSPWLACTSRTISGFKLTFGPTASASG
jgi:hypothetical protein